jgi:tripartite-type tricarboxylate transporter receptor subunit TctC
MNVRKLNVIPFAAALLLAAGGALAQAWPTKPIKLVVPFPPGGSSDTLARIFADGLSTRLGQPVIPENKPGANTIVGTEFVATQAPDGYTLFLCTPGVPINPSLYKVRYDPEKSFTFVSLLASLPLILVTHPDVPVKSMKDVVDLAKSRPGELTYASYGMGSASHLAGELVKAMTGAEMLHVPFKGSSAAVTEVIAGRASMSFTTIPMVVPFIKAGRVKPIGVTSLERVDIVKDQPTLAEAGLPGFEVLSWNGLCGPAGLPKEMVQRLHKAVVEIVAAPESRKKLVDGGYVVKGSTPAEFQAFVAAEVRKWGKLVREANVKAD